MTLKEYFHGLPGTYYRTEWRIMVGIDIDNSSRPHLNPSVKITFNTLDKIWSVPYPDKLFFRKYLKSSKYITAKHSGVWPFLAASQEKAIKQIKDLNLHLIKYVY